MCKKAKREFLGIILMIHSKLQKGCETTQAIMITQVGALVSASSLKFSIYIYACYLRLQT